MDENKYSIKFTPKVKDLKTDGILKISFANKYIIAKTNQEERILCLLIDKDIKG